MAGILKDEVTITVSGSANVDSKLRDVPGAPWLKWSLHAYPRGKSNTSGYIEVYIRVVGGNAHVNASLQGQNGYNGQVDKLFQREFKDGEEHACTDFCSSNHFTFQRYPLQITCTATFKPTETKLAAMMVHELVDESKPHFSNATIVIGTEEIKVHRGFLSMLSPVFTAMFSPETKESKTGIVNITDFPVATVRNAINYCYGADLGLTNSAEVVAMLEFYDKYDMQPLMTKLENWLKANMTIKYFAPIAAYAWKYSRLSFQADCGRMFHQNRAEIVDHPDFVALDPTVIAGVVKAGYTSTGRTISGGNS